MRIAVRKYLGDWMMMYPDHPKVPGSRFDNEGVNAGVPFLLSWENRNDKFKDSWTIYELDEL